MAPPLPPPLASTMKPQAVRRGLGEGMMGVGRKRRGPRILGLVLSGGGARGAFHVGVYERLLEDPRFADGPTVISGTSAGVPVMKRSRGTGLVCSAWHGQRF